MAVGCRVRRLISVRWQRSDVVPPLAPVVVFCPPGGMVVKKLLGYLE
jgi:hypothetical protein